MEEEKIEFVAGELQSYEAKYPAVRIQKTDYAGSVSTELVVEFLTVDDFIKAKDAGGLSIIE